jgi:selenocysteine lyase/cysteine desulfurase
MEIARRSFLAGSGLALAAGSAAAQSPPAVAPGPATPPAAAPTPPGPAPQPVDWRRIRAQFALTPEWIDMSAMLIASHPAPVREAIERHRRQLDANPIIYLEANNRSLQNRARAAAGQYLGAPAEAVALTDSTTMGAGLVYNGLRLRYGQEILTTDQDYYVTHESLRLAALRTGAKVRRISLYEDVRTVSEAGLVARLTGQITPQTRVLALTWVHSSTGLKLPVSAIAAALAPINASRAEADRVLLCVDGVHGFGNQDVGFAQLGCDFLFAGCHKWLFGPRGTGVIFGSDAGWRSALPTIPTFLDSNAYSNWISGADPGQCSAVRMTPGGFKAFEHLWALTEAFWLHQNIGRAGVARRTAELATQLKEGLAAMPHVTLVTPRSPALSAGIVSFDVAGMSAHQVVSRLRDWKVIASVAPYARPHARLTPSIRNFPHEIDFALQAIRGMA